MVNLYSFIMQSVDPRGDFAKRMRPNHMPEFHVTGHTPAEALIKVRAMFRGLQITGKIYGFDTDDVLLSFADPDPVVSPKVSGREAEE